MACSMTAFARVDIYNEYGTFVWELRSVNSRFLDINLRLPELFNVLDMSLRDVLKHNFTRGKITAHLQFTPNEQETKLSLNSKRALEVVDAAHKIAKLTNDVAAIDPLDLLKFDGVLQVEAPDTSILQDIALKIFDKVILKLQEARRREGNQLLSFIREILDQIGNSIATLEVFLPQITEEMRNKIILRAADLAIKIEPMRLEQEIALLLSKNDAKEELDRLKTHINEFYRILGSSSAIGRRLDFLLQELMREANTLGAKAYDMHTTNTSIDIKVWIEQIREQVQNIE